LLNALVPRGTGLLVHIDGAVPVNALVVIPILYTLVNTVTAVLNVNCNTFVNAKQFLNVPAKLSTFIFWSNNVLGTDVNPEQPRKAFANVVAFGTLSNNPFGTDDIVVIDEKQSVNVVAFGE
jgi:hypothetical protein